MSIMISFHFAFFSQRVIAKPAEDERRPCCGQQRAGPVRSVLAGPVVLAQPILDGAEPG